MPRESKAVERHIPRLDQVITKITCSRCGTQERIFKSYAHSSDEDRISGRFKADLDLGNVELPTQQTCQGPWPANLIEADLCGQCTLDFIEWVKMSGGDVDYKYYDPMGG